jgi:hypothetical protein
MRDGESAEICSMLRSVGLQLDAEAARRFSEYRRLYDPFVVPLSHRLEMPLPSLTPQAGTVIDDWQRSAWDASPDIERS